MLDIGKHLAEWANHATGSAKGGLSRIPGVSNAIFGPKLTQSKLNRLFVDPVKTVYTFAHWKNATPGEKAVAWTRLSGAIQYLGSGVAFLGINQGVLWATGQKDKINFDNPFAPDFLSFKGFGLEGSFPGMHSEIRTLGKILFDAFKDSKSVSQETRGGTKFDLIKNELEKYAFNKVNPIISVIKEGWQRARCSGQRLPWAEAIPAKHGKPAQTPIGWGEYLLSHGPIPLTGPNPVCLRSVARKRRKRC